MNKRLGDYRLDGRNPFSYMGVKPYTPPQMIVMKRAPTANDFQGLSLGTQWLYQLPQTPNSSIQYVLVKAAQNQAIWIPLNDGGTFPTLAQNQVVLGTGAPGLSTVGSLGTNQQVLTSQGIGSSPLWDNDATGMGIGSLNIIVINTPGSGTYTPSPNMIQCTVECIGGGGGGQGAGSVIASGQGGGGGAYCKNIYSISDIGSSQPYNVGSAGTGGIGNTTDAGPFYVGSDGEGTTFGSGPTLITAGGGSGGGLILIPNGGIATGADLNIPGQSSTKEFINGGSSIPMEDTVNGYIIITATGGSSALGYGSGGIGITLVNSDASVNGTNGVGYGSGGGGSAALTFQAPPYFISNGGNGTSGLIIITEYIAS